MLAAIVLAHVGLLHAQKTSFGEPDLNSSLRARAWVTIAAINDRSIRKLESHDIVKMHAEDGQQSLYADYTVKSDIMRNLTLQGDRLSYLPHDMEHPQKVRLDLSIHDGVVLSWWDEDNSVVVRPESPDIVLPWCVPGPLMGLGRFVNLNQLRLRSDHLFGCPDLRVESETSQTVVVKGVGKVDNRSFEHRLELDRATSDINTHQVREMKWGTLFVEWRMPQWQEFGGARIPTHIEYRVYEPAIGEESVRRLRELLAASGLDVQCTQPDHPDYNKWVEIRDKELPDKGSLVRLAADWQSCDSTIISVNSAVEPNWLQRPSGATKPTVIFSHVLECEVDQLSLEPAPNLGAKP
jgi:hypothetical protein